MKNSLETRLGLFTAIIVLAAVFVLEMLGSLDGFKKAKHLHALFNSVQELKVGDRVKMAGVEVGRVEKISLVESKVKVSMRVDTDAQVKTDSVATIRFAGLMGQNFVALDFGSPASELADDNTHLPTQEQADLNSIMQKLDNVAAGVEEMTKSFSGDKIDNIIGPLTEFFKNNMGPISSTFTNIEVVTAQIAEGKGTLGKLVMDDALYKTSLATVSSLENTSTNMAATFAEVRSLVADAKAGKGSLGKALTDDALYNETTASMTNLKEILEKVNHGKGTVAKLVNEPDFYNNAKLTMQKLDKATESLEDQGPISVLGTLFQTFY